MHRPRLKGGLGIHHVKSKALAILIRSFLETAISPKFIRNQYHNALFKWHVLGDTTISDPCNSPYYSSASGTGRAAECCQHVHQAVVQSDHREECYYGGWSCSSASLDPSQM